MERVAGAMEGGGSEDAIGWLRIVPFMGLHLACLAVFAVGVSAAALAVAVVSYLVRAFAVSAFYHRCFSHRAFRAGRGTQFVFATLGAAATQRGPLWWAAHHRLHHTNADTGADPHNAGRGFCWSHMGWFLTRRHFRTPLVRVRDLARFPELRWLNRFDLAAPVAYGASMFALGEALGPDFGTNGWQMLVWGYVLSTVALMHATFLVNSVAHRPGPLRRRQRPFDTRDSSRNLWWLALITMGEGWHNNHHRHAGSARLGFRWWQLDLAWLGLKLLAALGLVTDLKPAPTETERPCASR
ncbi:MAG: acyl-CoA desaturase [Gammaproteobacteria bacterium]|nr:acyl-CoA desaturase [Gammaproteobacteria bacterium]